ncbi:MAG: pilus assembly PilX N-terminal domain-containing protein [Candidatus Omnitrophica bacterium]|nr:pilus assembly PilX N-terminal domain-containing protein [Candidatus Omnitrophota bacterium]
MNNDHGKKGLARLTEEKGSVLLTTFLLITVLLILGAAFVVATMNENRIAEANRRYTQAFNIAEAGIERMIYYLKEDFAVDKDWSDGEVDGWTYDSTDVDANNYFPFPDVSDAANAAYPPSTLGDGSYAISLKSSADDEIWIRSVGTIGSIRQTIEVFVRVIALSPWDNAIFGGAGSSGAMVNGNVKIMGSVHILGNGLADGDNAIDLGGTAELVGNNYDGLEADLDDRVPELDTVLFNGENVETLNAELRVKKGLVGLSGTSKVGNADASGDGDKETVDGTYVTDGYNGTAGTTNVFSDNGSSEGYDLGDAVTFPSLNDSISGYDDYYAYFSAEGYTLAAGELATVAALSGATPNFTYGNCATNCISMTGGKLYVKGKVYVNGGTLGITGSTVEYTGSGTILVSGDVTINEDLITATDLDPVSGNQYENYPVHEVTGQKNVLAIMTPSDIEMGTGAGAAQLDVMGLFFAEGEIKTAKQTDVMGSLVTNYFNVSNQVPSVWQVPDTSDNLPDGLITGDEIYLMRVISWRKIDNPT